MWKEKLEQLINFSKKGVGLLLFIVCGIAIYREVGSNQNITAHSVEIQYRLKEIPFVYWIVLLLMMMTNFIVESIKWKKALLGQVELNIAQALKSVFVGQAFAFYTPNRIGEYVGRSMMLNTENKVMTMARMAWSSYAQLLVTIIVGSFAIFIHPPLYNWLKWVSPLLAIFSLLVYFRKKSYSSWIRNFNFLQIDNSVKKELLSLSFLRYFIFLMQYTWAVHMLHIPIDFVTLWVAISVMFLCISILPTVSLTELVIRGQLIVLLLTPYCNNSLLLISLSTIIWLVNFLLPAIIGAFLLLSFRMNQ
jgi:hypothetical protein